MNPTPFILGDFPDPQIIFVFIMVVFAGIKALLEKARGESSEEESLSGYDDIAFYEEQERIFQKERETILRRQQRAQAPPLPTPIPQQEPPARTVKKPSLSKAEQEALSNFQKAEAQQSRPARSLGNARTRARRVLASPYAARDAVVLSEILGKPKSLQ